MTPQYVPHSKAGVFVCDAGAVPWQDAGKAGIMLKPIRFDGERGEFLGLVGFDAMARSGTHQHQAVASSYFIDGALVDHQGAAHAGQVGINLKGATHDAIAYRKTLLVSKLEGPVTYLPGEGEVFSLHAGAYLDSFETPDRNSLPDINVDVGALTECATGFDGVARRVIFDYAGTPERRRLAELSLRPRTSIDRFVTGARTELWIHGGAISINGQVAHANCFVIIEPQTEVGIASRFGARLLAWAEGPARWLERRDTPELFGFA
jgi:hypothetical protein